MTGSIQSDTTTLSFTMPLSSGDRYDVSLSPGASYDVIMAAGPNGAEDDSSYHGPGSYAIFTIVL